MRELILLRHAHAEAASAGQADLDRPLSAEGLAEAEAAGRWLAHGRAPVGTMAVFLLILDGQCVAQRGCQLRQPRGRQRRRLALLPVDPALRIARARVQAERLPRVIADGPSDANDVGP